MKAWQKPVAGTALRARRYADAVRNMRSRQMAYRARRAVPIRLLAAGTGEARPGGWRPLAGGMGVEPAPSTGPVPPPHRDGLVRAYGVERKALDPAAWRAEGDGLLFLFHLHGFQDLARYARSSLEEDGAAFWESVIGGWLDEWSTPALPGWHPYPMSGRVISWCAALSREGWLDGVRERMLGSLAQQLRVLGRSIEHDIGGNHVLHNGAALVIGGACLGADSAAARGLALLRSELARQVLADGGHEERSPSYHRLVLSELEDVATLLERAGSGAPGWLTHAIAAMESWLCSIVGPDGRLPPLNDAWDGPPVPVSHARPPVETLMPSGYVVVREADAQAVLDAGPVSPPHLPAHAHADVLSLVHWAGGVPVLIDPGSGSYAGPDRDAFRGTAAHNTVQVDGEDQLDLWGTFRAAGLPRVQVGAIERVGEGVTVVRAHHDGYRRLQDPVVHERTFVWLGTDGIAVVDRLRCAHPHGVVSRLHFADGLDDPLASELPGGLRLRVYGDGLESSVATARRSPYIGVTTPVSLVEMEGRVGPGQCFGWQLTRPEVELRLDAGRLVLTRPGEDVLAIDLPGEAVRARA